MTAITILSLIMGLLFIIYSLITFKAKGILFNLVVRDEFIKKSYINKVKSISSILTTIFSFIFAYYNYNNIMDDFYIVFIPFIYIVARKLLIIVYDYLEIRKYKL